MTPKEYFKQIGFTQAIVNKGKLLYINGGPVAASKIIVFDLKNKTIECDFKIMTAEILNAIHKQAQVLGWIE